ncbi:PqqD family peptide modification chaperone [Hassallia byssoidea VB512170]|uniref:PqqD family peptide modification chaperone n=1 Tax=Hassallia byssoidea VB512170 TaxID=1304833 RepID=A0A846HH16_9CYAN|nr:PqqD family peptide modification chaperone [Hassalia byssoidea]NEU76656.1 PqqD family peptide modification chaperone [Hassalia byssoidea VB512170]
MQEILCQNEARLPSVSLPKIYGIPIDSEALAKYSRELQLKEPTEALFGLAQAIASSPIWAEMPGNILIVRPTPQPALFVLGCLDEAGRVRIARELPDLNLNITRLRYISYRQAEADCERLAKQLVDRFGYEELKEFHFTGIPRGGLIVLAMLAYALGLTPEQLEPPPSPDVPWVVVDDCVFTGSRLSNFLQSHSHEAVIFAVLYSHPDLRRAIASREPHVKACLSAQDIHDYAPEDLGDSYPDWQAHCLAQLDGIRYWVGKTDNICFSWNEPDRFVWNPVTEKIEGCWLLIPPEICLKNRLKAATEAPIIQIQPESKGLIQPGSQVIFGEYEGQIVVGNLATGESFCLTGVAADIWQAYAQHGDVEQVVMSLLSSYDVEEATLRCDVETFIDELYTQGLLVKSVDAKR